MRDVVDNLSEVSILCPVGVIIRFTSYSGSSPNQLQTLDIVLGDDGRFELVQSHVAVP